MGLLLPETVEEGDKPPLVLHLARLAPQKGQAGYIVGGKFPKQVVFGCPGEGLSVIEIPGLGLEAIFAVVAAAGDEEGHPDPGAVGDVTGFDGAVVHGDISFLLVFLGKGNVFFLEFWGHRPAVGGRLSLGGYAA